MQDMWLLTADNGIKALSKLMCYPVPGALMAERHKEQLESNYWMKCDKLFQQKIMTRIQAGISPLTMPKTNNDDELIWKNIQEAERQILELY
jgi:hypothetical protein